MINGFKIITQTDIIGRLEKYHRLGALPGVYLGFENMKDFYSMKQDSCTDWTGLPQSGKTELLLECLFNTSEFYGWKHLLLVPDIGDCIEVLAILIHKHTGKTFDKKYPNFISIQEAYKSCLWLLEHFKILEPQKENCKITPVEFWKYAVECKEEYGINTATIDSWKDLHHPYEDHGGNYARYLSDVLPIRNKLAELNNIHFHTVIHPKTPRRGKDGKLYHPQCDDMEGGAQWNNSGKTIISVHRETFDTTIADVQVLKAKPKVIGRRGFFALNFDAASSRYFETKQTWAGEEKSFAKKEIEKVKQNIDFTESTKELQDENPF